MTPRPKKTTHTTDTAQFIATSPYYSVNTLSVRRMPTSTNNVLIFFFFCTQVCAFTTTQLFFVATTLVNTPLHRFFTDVWHVCTCREVIKMREGIVAFRRGRKFLSIVLRDFIITIANDKENFPR